MCIAVSVHGEIRILCEPRFGLERNCMCRWGEEDFLSGSLSSMSHFKLNERSKVKKDFRNAHFSLEY